MTDLLQKCYDFQEADMVKAAGLYPLFRAMEGSVGSSVVYQGRRVVMTGSNNYLGLTNDPRVKQAAKDAIDRFGTGCTGSRALNGNSVLHDELEIALADFVGKESGLAFTTGFLTNLGVISCMAEEGDYILSDGENHASIIAGCKGSKATVVPYRHNDMLDLENKLKELPADSGKLIVTDGVFSMTGEIVNLPELVAVKKKFTNAYLYLDDAHGLGVLGNNGRGTADHFGLTDEVDLIMGTFSKSFASLGGFVAGKHKVVDYIRHQSRAFIFSAAMPPSAAAAAFKALEIMRSDKKIFDRLWKNVTYIRNGFDKIGLAYVPSETPIISIFVGDEGKAFQLVKTLFEKNVFATPVLFPAVPFGHAMIRTSYMASHTEEDLDEVLDVFAEIASEFGILRSQVEIPKEFSNRGTTWNFDSILTPTEA